jgi:polyvinyl alcohol dehydrogenase (cytochrome)
MRVLTILAMLPLVFACSDGNDSRQAEPLLLPFETYPYVEQPRGGACDNSVDINAPLIVSGLGFNFENTRNSASIINADNINSMRLNYTVATEGVSDMRGAAAANAQALFFTAGNALSAINRYSGCSYWRYTNPVSRTPFRSAAVLLAERSATEATIYLGDYDGYVHAVDAATGEQRWKVFAGTNPSHHFVTGGMQAYEDTLIVPISSKEVVTGAFLAGGCCESHGMLVALDADTGERLWEYHTTAEATRIIEPNARKGPNGAPVWSVPTIDRTRNAVVFGTGQNYTEPTTLTSDAIISLDLADGQVNWVFQATAGDAWNYACEFGVVLRCPSPEGHDFDFGAAPMLLEDGNTLIAGDKGGMVYALNADNGGLIWSRKLSIGTKLGGIHWGMATDGVRIFAAATDFEIDPASGNLEDLIPGANPGIYALDIVSGETLWEIHPSREYEGLETPLLFSASLSVTNDVLLAGALDGTVKAFSVSDGAELWQYNVDQSLNDVNGIAGDGGTIDGAGIIITGDGLVVNSGYTALFGGIGRYQAGTGNTLFVFTLEATGMGQ